MQLKKKKAVKAAKSKSHLSQNSAHHAPWRTAKILLMPVLGILIFAIIFSSFQSLGKNTLAGKATEASYPSGYYWSEDPADGGKDTNGAKESYSVYVATKVKQDQQSAKATFKGYCPDAGFCLYQSKPGAKEPDYYCYRQASIVPDTTMAKELPYKMLCTDYNNDQTLEWVYCINTDKAIQDLPFEQKFVCDGTSWKVCLNEGLANGDKYYCDGTTWSVCNAQNASRVKQKYLCDGTKWKLCQKEGFLTNTAYYCDGVQWNVCNAQNKGLNVAQKYVCDGTLWKACFNQFCALDKSAMLATAKAGFDQVKSAVSGVLNQKGDQIGTAVDVAENKAFYNLLSSSISKIYFKYNQKNYVVELTSSNVTAGTAQLEVKNIEGKTKGMIKLAMTADSPWSFPPQQLGVNLEGDDAIEIYLTALGYFGSDNKLNLLLVINPKLNFNQFASGQAFLAAGNTQIFSFAGEHNLALAQSGALNYVLFIDGVEYTTASGVHYFDPQKSQKVYFSQMAKSGSFILISLTKSTEGLKQSYEESLLAGKLLDTGATLGLVKICSNDPAALKQALKICDKNEKELFSLADKGLQEKENLLFWYQQPSGSAPKEGKVFYLLPLVENQVVQQSALTFSGNLVQAKRLALKVKDTDYLLSHAQATYLDLTSLQLTDLSNKDLPAYKAEGDQSEIVFNLPLKRQVSLKLNFIPELAFDLSTTTIVKKSVNLLEKLQASVSTYGAVTLTAPQLGEVGVAATDIATYQDKMKIYYSGSQLAELSYKKPKVIGGNTLFYYNSFTSAGLNTYTKYADIYLYYNLTKNAAEHVFNDELFILPLAKGNKIALELEGNLYLLKYGEAWGPDAVSGFSASKMQLTGLEGEKVYTAQPAEDGNGVFFTLGPRKIVLTINTDQQKISFEGVTAVEAAKAVFDPEQNYSAFLPASTPEQKNLLEVVGGKSYYNCDTPATKAFTGFFLLCWEGYAGQQQVEQNKPVELKSGAQPLLLWYWDKKGAQKKITVHKMFTLKETPLVFDWELLTGNLDAQKDPIFKWQDQWFELLGKTELGTFAFKSVPSGEIYLIQLNSTEEGYNQGAISVKEQMFYFEQSLVNFNLKVAIKPLPQKLVDSEGFNVTDAVLFTPAVGSSIYNLHLAPFNEELIQVSIEEMKDEGKEVPEDNLFFTALLPEKASQQVLLPSGEIVTLEVLNVAAPVVLLKK